MDLIRKSIDYIGFWNLFSILTFVLGIIYTAYTFYKSFFRLVYTYQKTCQGCVFSKQWKSESQNFVSRIIFFNNGRKTLTNSEVTKIQVISSEISLIKIKSDDIGVKTRINRDRKALEIKFGHLDASKFIIVEISHVGNINVKGRIAETGTLLHTETRGWLIINFILVVYCFASMFYLLLSNLEKDLDVGRLGINLIIIFLFSQLFRYIHKLFFIPETVTKKYLQTTDKRKTEFSIQL